MKQKIIFAILVSISTVSSASDWVRVGLPSDGVVDMDFDSIAQVGAYRKVWVRTDYYFPVETETYPKKKYRSVKSLYYFDCSAKTKTVVQSVGYEDGNGEGVIAFSETVKFNPNQLDDIVPDTIGESFMKAACTTPGGRDKIRAQAQAREKALHKYMDDLLKDTPKPKQARPDGT